MNISVILLHTLALIRDSLAGALESHGFGVEAMATAEDVMGRIRDMGPSDILLMDTYANRDSALPTVQRLSRANAGGATIALIGPDDERFVPHLLESGARGVIPSTMSIRSVPNAIGLVHSGEIFVPVELRRAGMTVRRIPETAEENGIPILSATDMQLLRQAADGLTGKEIAKNLGMTEVSIKMHVRSICRKLGARNRTHAAMLARQMGLI